MKQKTYCKHLETESEARELMVLKNRACERAGNKDDTFCLVEGPDDFFSVVDLDTAIDIGLPYEWSYN